MCLAGPTACKATGVPDRNDLECHEEANDGCRMEVEKQEFAVAWGLSARSFGTGDELDVRPFSHVSVTQSAARRFPDLRAMIGWQ